MHWLYANINHLVVPLGMLLGLFAAFMGYFSKEHPERHVGAWVRNAMTVVIILCAVLLGIFVAKNFA